MSSFYTIVGVGLDDSYDPVVETDTSWNARRGVRSYKTVGAAKSALKQSDLPSVPVKYRILRTIITPSGDSWTEWVE